MKAEAGRMLTEVELGPQVRVLQDEGHAGPHPEQARDDRGEGRQVLALVLGAGGAPSRSLYGTWVRPTHGMSAFVPVAGARTRSHLHCPRALARSLSQCTIPWPA